MRRRMDSAPTCEQSPHRSQNVSAYAFDAARLSPPADMPSRAGEALVKHRV